MSAFNQQSALFVCILIGFGNQALGLQVATKTRAAIAIISQQGAHDTPHRSIRNSLTLLQYVRETLDNTESHALVSKQYASPRDFHKTIEAVYRQPDGKPMKFPFIEAYTTLCKRLDNIVEAQRVVKLAQGKPPKSHKPLYDRLEQDLIKKHQHLSTLILAIQGTLPYYSFFRYDAHHMTPQDRMAHLAQSAQANKQLLTTPVWQKNIPTLITQGQEDTTQKKEPAKTAYPLCGFEMLRRHFILFGSPLDENGIL